MTEPLEQDAPPITVLTKGQRRVLGTLLEKAFTTPEVYPLTLKAAMTGCNQKSNRHPMTEYTEDDVHDFLDQLREMGLVAVVHTETGRTERYRHYMRKRFTLTEPQLAILTELLLRGRQSVGELRARASRMVPIASLEELREALGGLMAQGYVQASGPLERRGVEVDHGFYEPGENKKIEWDGSAEPEDDFPPTPHAAHAPVARPQSAAAASPTDGSPALQATVRQLQGENRELAARVESLEAEVHRLKGLVDDLVRDLRG